MRNVEIKAKVKDINLLISKVKSIQPNMQLLQQHDTFFNVPHGRLKLRKFENGNAELIYYERSDTEGPKLSSFEKASIPAESASDLLYVLQQALGAKSTVEKVRHLALGPILQNRPLVGQTRVHVDSVKGLGDFMELEVLLEDHQSLEDGEKIASELMEKLEIKNEDLVSGAYADLLNK